ncbi:uncharacterized protein LOC118198624 [Stegodyphus dumicola]|uniref:uncharacterized protein LOC118198624 n=1 Tax=Stegodyphus dumicola TaxID=202533 RepID=UPI0015B0881D|nr:uncharacterized protein LOC118198624 [Stegodyphus dumicola]
MMKQYSKNSKDQDDDRTFLYRLFHNEIKKYHICNLIPHLLDLADFDTHQKVVEAMNSLKPICLEDFQTKEIQLSLAALLTHYDPAGVMNYPLFPLIDPELKEMLFKELKILYSSITPARLNENEIYSKKTEL